MNSILSATIIAALMVLTSSSLRAEQIPILLIDATALADSEAFEKAIQDTPLFANLGSDQYGSPLLLLASLSSKDTGTNLVTGLISATAAGISMGVLPVITNRDLTLHYEVRLHRVKIFEKSFEKNFTGAEFIYSPTDGLKSKQVMRWATETAAELSELAMQDEDIQEVLAEYEAYFPQN